MVIRLEWNDAHGGTIGLYCRVFEEDEIKIINGTIIVYNRISSDDIFTMLDSIICSRNLTYRYVITEIILLFQCLCL